MRLSRDRANALRTATIIGAVLVLAAAVYWRFQFTSSSAARNVQEFQGRGLLDPLPAYGGAPRAAIQQIERLFLDAERGGKAEELKRELDRWGLFQYYEDRFLNLFRRR